MTRRRIRAWVAIGTLAVGFVSAVPAYIFIWNTPKLVYEQRLVEILLPDKVKKRFDAVLTEKGAPPPFPDKLLLITIQNIGRRPSEQVEAWIEPPGQLVAYDLQEPNPAYGHIEISEHGSRLQVFCARLIQGEHLVRLSIWFRQDSERELNVGISDQAGPAKLVDSIAAEKKTWMVWLIPPVFVVMLTLTYFFDKYLERLMRTSLLATLTPQEMRTVVERAQKESEQKDAAQKHSNTRR